MKSQCQFEVAGQRCVGTLYRPNRPGPVPCVRHWGDSEGTPRELCKPSKQIADIHAAIDYVRKRSDVDAAAITLFGSSVGGGHALLVASQRGRTATGRG